MKEKRLVFKIFILLAFLNVGAYAQFQSAEIGIDGLTCSACSFSTEKALMKLAEVDSVSMHLENNTATVFFKQGKKINMGDVARKVVDAGFAVRSLSALLLVDELNISPDSCWQFQNDVYHFVRTEKMQVRGQVTFQFIGDKFMSSKAYKKWKLFLTTSCATAIVKAPNSSDYYVTLP